jgi:hypothetical protein
VAFWSRKRYGRAAARTAQPAAYDAQAQDQADRDSQRPIGSNQFSGGFDNITNMSKGLAPTGNSRDRQQVPSLAERLRETCCCTDRGSCPNPSIRVGRSLPKQGQIRRQSSPTLPKRSAERRAIPQLN